MGQGGTQLTLKGPGGKLRNSQKGRDVQYVQYIHSLGAPRERSQNGGGQVYDQRKAKFVHSLELRVGVLARGSNVHEGDDKHAA